MKRIVFFQTLFFLLLFLNETALSAVFSTRNFTVTADDPRVAEVMANRAEELRSRLADFWLGKELPSWYKKCRIKIQIGNVSAGGATTFTFKNGEVYDWNMTVQGSRERIYDSVLPHEITHTILASHFRTPLPRWADEGAATFVEHDSERAKYRQQLYSALKTNRGIPLDQLFDMEEYPEDPLPLYAHGYSLAEFLIRQRGPRYYISFIEACLCREESWNDLVYEFYGYESLRNLQNDWVGWVQDGTPEFQGTNLIPNEENVVVSADPAADPSEENVRGMVFHDSVKVVPESKVRPQPNLVQWNTTHVNGPAPQMPPAVHP